MTATSLKLRIYERPSLEEKLYHFKLNVTEAPLRASDSTSAPPAADSGVPGEPLNLIQLFSVGAVFLNLI
ncbi:unnamed protein product [Knipowitschia caucasica]|uniref:Uncharacterized protein n=1 Tax=Knipowitschia caucasica TaxID=637954 RepID=A0AAV2LJ10_KNICA